MKKFWDFKAAVGNEGSLYIYGDIVSYRWDDQDTTAQSFKEDLDALGDIDTLNLYINSPGGSVFQGVAIYNILKRHKARVIVHVDGLAASIASIIAMAGDSIHMPENAMMMVHNPWTFTWGNADDLRKEAEALDKIRESMIETYLLKAGDKLDKDMLIKLLDDETWLTAKECLDYGLCDTVGAAKEVAASVNSEVLAKYRQVPDLVAKMMQRQPENHQIPDEERQKMLADSKQNLESLQKILGGL